MTRSPHRRPLPHLRMIRRGAALIVAAAGAATAAIAVGLGACHPALSAEGEERPQPVGASMTEQFGPLDWLPVTPVRGTGKP